MATVRSLGDGRWQARLYLEIDGRVLRPSRSDIYARNRHQALQKANAWQAEVERSGRTELGHKTVGDACDAWYEACQHRGLAHSTLVEYARHRDAIKEALGAKRVDKLTVTDVERYYADVRKTSGVKHRHAALRSILGEARRLGWVGANVAELSRRRQEIARREAPPTLDEIARLIKVAYARSEECGNFVVVSVGTGMRRGEVAGMRVSRVEWDTGIYVVDTALSNLSDESGLIVKEPKTRQVRRMPMSDAVEAAVRRQVGLLERRARVCGVELVADPWLWSADADARRPRRPDWFSKEFAACREAAGVSGRLHDLRHAAATIWIDQGVPVTLVSDLMGHANPHTTMSIYAHGVSSRAREAAELLGRAIGELGR